MSVAINSSIVGYASTSILPTSTSAANPSASNQSASTPSTRAVTVTISAAALSFGEQTSRETLNLDVASALALFKQTPRAEPVNIIDSGANIVRNLDALQRLGGKVNYISLSDVTNPLEIAADQLSRNSVTFEKIKDNFKLIVNKVSTANMMSVLGDARVSQISIVDSSINIAKKLADISAQGEKVISVAQTGATSALIINAEEYVASTIALGKISNAYTIGIKGATVNQLANFAANEKVRSITVTDSSENVATNINLIQSQSSKITQVSLTDDQKILNLSSDDFLNNGTTLRKIITPYKVNVMGVSLANLNSVATYKNVGSIHISDDSVNIASRLTDITRVSNKISSITQIGSPNTMQLNASQYLSSSPVLAKIQNPYTVNLTGVKTANLVAIAADSSVISMTIADTSQNLANNINVLNTLTNKITQVTQSGGISNMNLSAEQLTSNADILSKFSNSYKLDLADVSVAQAISLQSNAAVQNIKISDTSENIAVGLDQLQAMNSKIHSINQTNSSTPIAMSISQMSTNANILNKINNNYAIGIEDSSANINSNLDLLANLGSKLVSVKQSGSAAPMSASIAQMLRATELFNKFSGSYSLDVVDSSQNINTYLDYLQGNNNSISSITQSGTLATLAVSANQVGKNTQAFAKIAGSYTLAVTDSSANIATNLDALQAKTGRIVSITQSGTATALSITASQVVSGASALSMIGGAYTLEITDTSTNIATNLNALQDQNSKIISITQSGTAAPLSVNVSQITSAAPVLTKIAGSYRLAVTDSSANIASGIDLLQTQGVIVSSITQNLPASELTITNAQRIANSATLAKIDSGSYTLKATNVAPSDAVSVLTDSHVTRITLSSTELTASQYTTAVASKNITSGLTIAAVVLADAMALATDTNVQKIKVSSGTNLGTITNSTFTNSYQTALNKLYQSDGIIPITVSVTEVTASSAANLGSDSHVSSITLSETTLTAEQYTTAVASKNTTGSLTVTGVTAANAMALAADTRVTSIQLGASESFTTLTAGDYDATKLAKIRNSANSNVSVSVTGVDVTNATTVAADTNVSSLTLAATTLTAAQYTTAVASKNTTGSLTVTGVAVANAATVAADTNVSSLTLAATTLTAAQYTTAVASKNTTGSLTVTGVAVANAATVANNARVANLTLASTILTAAQYTADVVTKNTTTGLTITGVSVANAATVAADAKVSNLYLATSTLSASQYTTNVANKNLSTGLTVTGLTASTAAGIAANSKISSITLTDNTLTASEYTTSVASKNTSTGLVITGVDVADAATVAASANVNGITLAATSLTGSQYTADVASKNATPSLTISDVTVSDAASVAANANVSSMSLATTTLTAAQYTADVVSKNTRTGLTITDVAVASAATVAADTKVSNLTLAATTLTAAQYTANVVSKNTTGSLTVTGVAIGSALALANDANLIKVVVNSGSSLGSVASATFIAGQTAYNKLYQADGTTPVYVSVTGVPVASAATVAANSHVSTLTLAATTLTAAQYTTAVASKNTTGSLTVTGVDINAALNLAIDRNVSQIHVSSGSSLGSYSASQYATYKSRIEKIYQVDGTQLVTVTIAGATASQAANTLIPDSRVTSLTVSDTTANIDTYYSQINVAKVTQITATG